MGKTINMDQFKSDTKVLLDGNEYTIRQMSVKDIIASDMEERLEAAETDDDKFGIMLEFAGKMTDIPEEVLLGLNMTQFNMLIAACQGVEVEAE